MSDENVGGLVELLPCPFCGGAPELKWHGSGVPGMEDCGYVGIDCCIAHAHADDDESAIIQWNARALSAHGQPVVDGHLVERILNTRVPGGSLVWWSINGGGIGIDDGHRNVVRRVLEAYLSMKGATP